MQGSERTCGGGQGFGRREELESGAQSARALGASCPQVLAHLEEVDTEVVAPEDGVLLSLHSGRRWIQLLRELPPVHAGGGHYTLLQTCLFQRGKDVGFVRSWSCRVARRDQQDYKGIHTFAPAAPAAQSPAAPPPCAPPPQPKACVFLSRLLLCAGADREVSRAARRVGKLQPDVQVILWALERGLQAGAEFYYRVYPCSGMGSAGLLKGGEDLVLKPRSAGNQVEAAGPGT